MMKSSTKSDQESKFNNHSPQSSQLSDKNVPVSTSEAPGHSQPIFSGPSSGDKLDKVTRDSTSARKKVEALLGGRKKDSSFVKGTTTSSELNAPSTSQAPTTESSEVHCLWIGDADLRQLMERPKQEATFAQMTFLCVLMLTLYLITLSMSNMVNSDGFKPYQHHAALINISFAGVFGACIVAKAATYVGELRWARGLGFAACGVAIVSCLLLVFAVYLH